MKKKQRNKTRNLNMKKLLLTMLKIGCIGFGGGTALVPVIESEVVYENKLIDREEYTKDVVVANITPGAHFLRWYIFMNVLKISGFFMCYRPICDQSLQGCF